jgi:hypothetical protein
MAAENVISTGLLSSGFSDRQPDAATTATIIKNRYQMLYIHVFSS